MLLDSVPSLQPKFLNGKQFYEYGQPSLNTDYTSKGEAFAKFRDSTQSLYGISPSLMGHQNFINNIVLSDALPFVESTHNQNMKAFETGMPAHTSSSLYPSFTGYDSRVTTVTPKFQNALGSQFSFIRPKGRFPAFLKHNGEVDINAMKNTLRPTNGSHFTDSPVKEPITEGLYSSRMNNYLAMPINPNFPNKDATIYVFHNNNTRLYQYPNREFVNVIRNLLPIVNAEGFNTYTEAEQTRERIARSCVDVSTQTLVRDFIVVKSNNKYYVLPGFD